MKAGAAIAIFALLFLARTAVAEEESYVFGPASFSCEADQYQSLQFNGSLPDDLRFLIGARGDDVGFSGVDVNGEFVAGIKGAATAHQKSFNLGAKMVSGGKGFSGVLEIFLAKDFCSLLDKGITIYLSVGSDQVARIRLVNGDKQLIPNEAARKLTLDRIGFAYYDTLKFFLSGDYPWLAAWEARTSENRYRPTIPDVVWYEGDYAATCRTQWQEPDPCVDLGNMFALDDLLAFMHATNLYRAGVFPEKNKFKLTDMPFSALVAGDCLRLVSQAATVNLCMDYHSYLHIATLKELTGKDNLGLPWTSELNEGDFGLPKPK